jgi:hypothetical protein
LIRPAIEGNAANGAFALRNVHSPAGVLLGALAHQISDHESAKGERRIVVGQCHSAELFNLGSIVIAHDETVGGQVKGRMQDLMVYELLGMAKSDDPEIEIRPEDKRLSEMTWAASKSFEKGDFVEAARQYREILGEFPNDAVAKTMLAWLVAEHRPDSQ